MSSSDGRSLLEQLNPQCPQMKITDDGTGELSFSLNSTENYTSPSF